MKNFYLMESNRRDMRQMQDPLYSGAGSKKSLSK